MAHWYGWLGLAFVLLCALDHGMNIVATAWTTAQASFHLLPGALGGRPAQRSQPSIFWLAVWTTVAVAMVVT